jgi:hypothetical protein
LLPRVVLVFDLSHDLLYEVLDRDDAGGAAVLVDDDDQLMTVATHLDQQGGKVPRLRDDQGRTHDLGDGRVFPFGARDRVGVLDVGDPYDVVDPLTAYRESRVPALERGV